MAKIVRLANGKYMFYCTACKEMHQVGTGAGFNQDYDEPSFARSIYQIEGDNDICHLWMKDGILRYIRSKYKNIRFNSVEMSDLDKRTKTGRIKTYKFYKA